MLRLLILVTFFISCKTEPIRQEIEVGKTIKIIPSNFNVSGNDFNFLWSAPDGPAGNNSTFKIEGNKMLFTPDREGNYEVFLSIESANQNSLYEETFSFEAIESKTNLTKIKTTSISNTKSLENNKKEIQSDSKNQSKKNYKYTIQVASWPTLEQARKDQINLRENGYDAYTEQFYIKNKDQLWWRVRVGNFSNKEIALEVKNKLRKLKGNDLWIDFIE